MTPPEALTCRGVVKRAPGGATILNGVDLVVPAGRAVALMGANGAGKTTLLDIVCGLTSPGSGQVGVFGRTPRQAVSHGWVGGMLQSGGLLPEITVAETVGVVAALHGRRDRDALLERYGLQHLATHRVGTCSGGEQQWVRWALAQIPEPQLFVLDEPTAGMDWQARRRFWAQVAAHRERGTAVLYATHYADEVDDIADEIVLLHQGRVAAVTTPGEASARGDGARAEGAGGGALFEGLARLLEEGSA